MSQQSNPEIHYGYEPERALVKFQEPIDDFEPLENFTRKRKLENCVLSLEKIFESNAIQVYNINERTTEDCLELYFSCPKWSRGGDVEKIDLKKTEQLIAIVYFMDYRVVANVTRKQTHTLNGNNMTVRVYHAFLGPVDEDFNTSTPHLRLPKPLVKPLERERSIVCEKVTNLKSWETRFLLMNRFIATLNEKFQDLETKIELSKGQRGTIILKGVPQDCTDSKLHIYELLKTAVCRSSSLPPATLNLHQQDQCRKHVMECLKKKELEAVWEVEGEELKVYGNSQKESDAAIKFIGGLVVETKIQVDRKSSQLLTNNHWMQLVTSLSEKHKGLLEIIPKANNTDVAIVSIRELSKSVRCIIRNYISI
ncbi:unnamed protein product [Owenia fusiformis]|uniref:Uncharacterized protein n=1 Tax=Owenia fusiformis TaxID=6347 RepID=A0A8J1T561_OWEFU|nr:unnamed protein product [Owenia fusiformis]